MNVPFCNFNAQMEAYKQEMMEAIGNVLDSGQFIQGQAVKDLEIKLAKYTGAKHALTCANGTDALTITMKALGVNQGDEVILPAFTYFATAETISDLGAVPVFVDVGEDFQINPVEVRKAVTEKTRAIIVVSLFGFLPHCEELLEISKEFDIPIIEDGAQSFGAVRNGVQSCSFATISTTSFFPTKPLACYGDGGALFTDCDELASKIRLLRNHGQSKKYTHISIGQNSRLDTVQAAVLMIKLKHFENEIDSRRDIAKRYIAKLKEVSQIQLPNSHGLQDQDGVWAQFTIRTKSRDKLVAHLNAKGIPTAIHYPKPVYKQLAYSDSSNNPFRKLNCPVSEELSRTVLSLPICAFTRREDQNTVLAEVKSFFNQ